MEYFGIDVSRNNPIYDYKQVADSGKLFAIMRITERGNITDSSFEKNYEGFSSFSIKRGVYKYCYALNEREAQHEAEQVLKVLNGRKLELPVFYDVEWSSLRQLPTRQITAIIKAFRRVILDGGYVFGIYCNMDWYRHVLDISSLPYEFWLASYPYNDKGQIVESLRPSTGIGWQYSSKGQVPGITGPVDLDVFYTLSFGENPDEDKPEFLYTVQPGDTLSELALRYGTTVEELAALNDIENVDLIYIGQILRIPR